LLFGPFFEEFNIYELTHCKEAANFDFSSFIWTYNKIDIYETIGIIASIDVNDIPMSVLNWNIWERSHNRVDVLYNREIARNEIAVKALRFMFTIKKMPLNLQPVIARETFTVWDNLCHITSQEVYRFELAVMLF
jgi:hypothetical protein